MKGIIFNVVEEVVIEMFDADVWDSLLAEADTDGSYTSLGNYPDHELEGIVAAGCRATGETREGLLRIVGRRALPKLCSRVPDHIVAAPHPFAFIERVNEIIHPEVLKIYPDARPPVFACQRHPDGLLVTYTSARDLHALADGLLQGVGDRFGCSVVVECLEHSATHADFLVRLEQ